MYGYYRACLFEGALILCQRGMYVCNVLDYDSVNRTLSTCIN